MKPPRNPDSDTRPSLWPANIGQHPFRSPLLLMIGGGPESGKTTLAVAIAQACESLGMIVSIEDRDGDFEAAKRAKQFVRLAGVPIRIVETGLSRDAQLQVAAQCGGDASPAAAPPPSPPRK
jgi:hypothetical protein